MRLIKCKYLFLLCVGVFFSSNSKKNNKDAVYSVFTNNICKFL